MLYGEWHDALMDPPGVEHINKTVLIVKANKAGDKTITFGKYMSNTYKPISQKWEGTWTTNNGKGTVLYWMPIPVVPEEEK